MRGVSRQPAGMVRVAAPRFPAGMREAVVWNQGVWSYDDLQRAYAKRGRALSGEEGSTSRKPRASCQRRTWTAFRHAWQG